MSNTKHIRILRVTEYKGFHILVQQVIKLHIFQFIVFGNGQFYQAFNVISPTRGMKKRLSDDDVIKAGVVTLDMAYATIESLLAESADTLLKENPLGDQVVNMLEHMSKPKKGTLPN